MLSHGADPRGCGRSCASLHLVFSLIDRPDGFQLWAELLALAPGARCRLGRSFGSGAPCAMHEKIRWTMKLAMQWTASGLLKVNSHARNIRDPSRVLEQGPDRQRAPLWCSGGVSSICGASESRCYHNGSAFRGRQSPQRIRHRSLPAAIGLHEGASWQPNSRRSQPSRSTSPASASTDAWRLASDQAGAVPG
jgi:hypothetical protein